MQRKERVVSRVGAAATAGGAQLVPFCYFVVDGFECPRDFTVPGLEWYTVVVVRGAHSDAAHMEGYGNLVVSHE